MVYISKITLPFKGNENGTGFADEILTDWIVNKQSIPQDYCKSNIGVLTNNYVAIDIANMLAQSEKQNVRNHALSLPQPSVSADTPQAPARTRSRLAQLDWTTESVGGTDSTLIIKKPGFKWETTFDVDETFPERLTAAIRTLKTQMAKTTLTGGAPVVVTMSTDSKATVTFDSDTVTYVPP